MPGLTAETIELLQKAGYTAPASGDPLNGIQGVNLDYNMKDMYPVSTPLLKEIPRTTDGYAVNSYWKQWTGIETNTGVFGVPEGERGAVVKGTYKTFVGKYAGMGLDGKVTYEAQYSAQKFIDLLAKSKYQTLQSVLINEEKVLYAGNATVGLSKASAPVLSVATTGGSLTGTVNVFVAALTHKALEMVKPSVNGSVGRVTNLNALKAVIVHSPNGSSDSYNVNGGVAPLSDATQVVLTGSTNVITATTLPIAGAAGYAWFVGTAGNEKLVDVTSLSSVVIKAPATSTVVASAFIADHSKDEFVYDGLLSQIIAPNSGSTVVGLPNGSTLTSNGKGGINEIEDVLAKMWDNYKVVPQKMIMSAKTYSLISGLMVANGGAPLVRMNSDLNGGNLLGGGVRVWGYLSQITGNQIEFMIHPNAIEGSIMFFSNQVDNFQSQTGNLAEISCRRDYHEITFPAVNRTFQYGIYLDAMLKCYFTPAYGFLFNIAV